MVFKNQEDTESDNPKGDVCRYYIRHPGFLKFGSNGNDLQIDCIYYAS